MKHKLLESGAGFSLGMAYSRSLVRISAGGYDGRLVALMHHGAGNIKLTWSDPPYATWAPLTDAITDAADLPYDVYVKPDGSLLVAYSESGLRLAFKELTFSQGSWTPQSTIIVYDGDPAASPTLTIGPDGTYWIGYVRIDAQQQYFHVKPSSDNGQTWGFGPTSTGDQFTTPYSDINGRMLCGESTVHAVYTKDNTELVRRYYEPISGIWSAEDIIAAGAALGSDMNATFTANNVLHAVWTDGALHYRRHNGSFWEDVITVDPDGGRWPDLIFHNGRPTVIYLKEGAPDRHTLFAAAGDGVSFQAPQPFDRQYGNFDSVVAYAAGVATYADLTAEASNDTVGDIYHPSTNALVAQVDDQLFIGFEQPFRMLGIELAALGMGGQVSWSYWDSINWQSFTPSSGGWHFETSPHNLVLFDDYDSIPSNWQRSIVNGDFRYWIRARVTTEFTTAPVGTQLFPSVRIRGIGIAR